MSQPEQPRGSDGIAGKGVQGGVPADLQFLRFNVATNQWEFVLGAGGEANTISSVGGGTVDLSAVPSKVGVDLRVKTISVDANLSLTDVANLITLGLVNLPVLGTLPASPRQINITNAEIIAAAGILVNKLQALTVNKDVISDASGFLSTKSRELHVVKGTIQTVNNSTVLVNDTALLQALLANTEYGFKLVLFIDGAANADIDTAWTLPAGASGDWDSTSTVPVAVEDVTAEKMGALVAVGTVMMWVLHGRFSVAGTAGNAQLQWAQNVAQASDLSILPGSYLTVWEE